MLKIIRMISGRKKRLLFSFVIVLFGVGLFIWHRAHQSQQAIQPTVSVTVGDIVEDAQAIGFIKPRHSITVKSQIDGIVGEIYHWEGEYVTKGTPLLKITPAPSPTQYAIAKEELAEAEAIERSANKDADRFKTALERGYITPRYGDYITAMRDQEAAKLKRILAAQKLALIEQGNTIVAGKPIANIVVSPIDGYILTRSVDNGDPVISLSSAQASTALFSIANMSDLMFQGSVDESDAAKVTLNSPAVITVGAMSNVKITGVLSRIALQADSTSTDTTSPFSVGFKAEVTQLNIPNHVALRSGYSATADIKIQEAKHTLLLPERVIQFDQDKPYVLLPTKDIKNPKRQFIEIGLTDGINAQITKGLSAGQAVLDKPTTDDTNENDDSP